jgi:flagellar hook protein FlgE
MVKSMYAAVAGLKTHQAKMDVIGNNIANVNTYGYKKERASFADTYYATSSAASEATAVKGGANPTQIGYGVQMNSVTTIVTTGGNAITDNPTDVMIGGNGYFLVGAYNQDGITTTSSDTGVNGQLSLTSLYLTRVGMFNFDGQGNLVDGNAEYVYGYASARGLQNLYSGECIDPDAADPAEVSGYMYESTSEVDTVATAANNGTDVMQKYYVTARTATDGSIIDYKVYKLSTADSGNGDSKVQLKDAADTTDYYYNDDSLVMTLSTSDYEEGAGNLYTLDSNSDFKDAKSYTVQQTTGYVSNIATGVIQTTDELLTAVQIPRTYTLNGYVDEDGNPLEVTLYSKNDSVEVKLYTLDEQGQAQPVPEKDDQGNDIADTQQTMILSGDEYWDLSIACKMNSISIGSDGSVSGVDDKNRVMTIGKIAIADVPNPTALEAQGDNYYLAKANTGVIEACNPGEGSTGSLTSGALEMSNVDLSTEFTDMITTQRGYQANSRIITVTDTMLEELVNLKRS